MAYYTAVLERSGGSWQLRASEIEPPEDLSEVAEAVRSVIRGRGGLAILEREDEWFAIVRVDGEEDPRVFVSDLPAARKGPFGPVFADVEEIPAALLIGAVPADRVADRSDVTSPGAAGGGRGEEDEVDDEAALGIAGALGDGHAVLGQGAGPGDAGALDGEDGEDELDDDDDGLGDFVEELPRVSDPAGIGSGLAAPRASATEPVGSSAVIDEAVWAGDLSLLEDFGLSGEALRAIVEGDGSDPAAALLAIGEEAGFADVIDEWH